jgi:ubiquinone/menaquinone biosynthesis C-methylase UbiE
MTFEIGKFPTLEAGAGKVFVNEIEAGQLAIIEHQTPAKYAGKLVCRLGQFPENLDFPDSFFDGFYNARLLHFFGGDRIQASLIKFYRWLKPGGRVFLVNRCLREALALETLPSNKAGEFYQEATGGRSASHHLQVKAAQVVRSSSTIRTIDFLVSSSLSWCSFLRSPNSARVSNKEPMCMP